MGGHGHDHDDEFSELDPMDIRVRALETLLTEKGYIDPAALDELIDTYQTRIGPRNGAQVVARSWVDAEFLSEMGVRPYSHMPVWRPPTPGNEGFARFDLTPEIEAGLTFRPLAVTAKDTLDYHFSRTPERQAELAAGISVEREAEVLAAWHARS